MSRGAAMRRQTSSASGKALRTSCCLGDRAERRDSPVAEDTLTLTLLQMEGGPDRGQPNRVARISGSLAQPTGELVARGGEQVARQHVARPVVTKIQGSVANQASRHDRRGPAPRGPRAASENDERQEQASAR